jgi:hypothetical protein
VRSYLPTVVADGLRHNIAGPCVIDHRVGYEVGSFQAVFGEETNKDRE